MDHESEFFIPKLFSVFQNFHVKNGMFFQPLLEIFPIFPPLFSFSFSSLFLFFFHPCQY